MKKWFCMALVVFGMLGCSTVQYREPFLAKPVAPKVGEIMAVKQAVIVVDSSQSMRSKERFTLAKSQVESFVSAMPEGDYSTGLVVVGNQTTQTHSLEPFDRQVLAGAANQIPYLGGNTPLGTSLNEARSMLSGCKGKTAVIVFSDGRPTHSTDTLNAAKRLVDSYPDELCIHTVQIGDNKRAGEFLQKLSALTSCGSNRSADTIDNPMAMMDFVRFVFMEPDKDSDRDGVYDTYDRCPNTPKGAKVDDRGCWVISGVMFDLDKDIIKPAFYSRLDNVAKVLRKNPGLKVRIDGHACDRGTDEYNQDLSERRAVAVKSYLVQKRIKEVRMRTRGFGETRPAASNTSEANRAKNRRVELTVLK